MEDPARCAMLTFSGTRVSLYAAAGIVASITIACSSSGAEDAVAVTSQILTPSAVPAATQAPESPDPEDRPWIILKPTPEGTIAEQIRNGWLQGRVDDGWNFDITSFVPGLKVGPFTKPSVLGKDGIPSIDTPEYAIASSAPDYLRPEEPVIQININGDARAFPLSILMWHEIVNDTIGGEPVTVTFCPLCNSSIAFSGKHEGQLLDFGTTGWIANADLVMYDRLTETWWQQITGEGLIGKLAGTRLTFLPSSIVGWKEFADQYPDGKVLLRPTPGTLHPISGMEITHNRTYDEPPYSGYDVAGSLPLFFTGSFDSRLQPIDRVAALDFDGESVAYPFRALAVEPVVNDQVGDQEIVIFYDDGTESAFRTSTRGQNYQNSGSTTVFSRKVNGLTLNFSVDEAGTTWDKFGNASAGELAGAQLEPLVHGQEFWFAIATFRPGTEVRLRELLAVE